MQLNSIHHHIFKGQRLLLLAFLMLHTVAVYYFIAQHNITYDEPQYFEFAKHWLHGKPDRIEPLDDSKSPVIAIAWLPRIIRQCINPQYQLNDYGRKDQQEGRYMMILFSVITALYVYKWCKIFYGNKGWIMPMLLLLFDPLYLAYAGLMTTDLACGAFLVALLYHYKKYLNLQAQKDFYAAALFATLAVVTKQNMLIILVVLPLLSLLHYQFAAGIPKPLAKKMLWKGLLFLLIIMVGINVVYYFSKSFMPFGSYVFESYSLQHLQQSWSWLHRVPVPLPYSYVQSLDMMKAHAELAADSPGKTFNGVYLFGELKLVGNYWYYYIIHLLYKMPLGTMLLFIAGAPLFIIRFAAPAFVRHYMYLLVPAVLYFVMLSFFNQFQIGIRHLLAIYPLLFILLGYVFKYIAARSYTAKAMVLAAMLFTFVSVAMYYPYLIPYTNELITEKKQVYKTIYDSSIDYGQSDSSVKQFLVIHPQYKAASKIIQPGLYAVRMGDIINTYMRNENPYKWYRAYEPVAHYRYTVLLYHITAKDIALADWRKTNLRIVRDKMTINKPPL